MKKATYADYLLNDVFSSLKGIKAKRMFGGYGLYQDGIIFGIIADDELYFKADDRNRPEYEARGSKPFTYEAKGNKRIALSYWQLSAEVMEDRDLLAEWVKRAVAVSKSRGSSKHY